MLFLSRSPTKLIVPYQTDQCTPSATEIPFEPFGSKQSVWDCSSDKDVDTISEDAPDVDVSYL
jgi:hypothetical protein